MARKDKNQNEVADENVGEVTHTETEVTEVAATEKKSIVPSRYGDKYKKGGSDALANFINEQSAHENAFSFGKFFSLCRANGIPEAQVAKYEGQVEAKQHGSQGRARMTLRNMLATIARKNGVLVGTDGNEHAVAVAPLASRKKADVAVEQAEAA